MDGEGVRRAAGKWGGQMESRDGEERGECVCVWGGGGGRNRHGHVSVRGAARSLRGAVGRAAGSCLAAARQAAARHAAPGLPLWWWMAPPPASPRACWLPAPPGWPPPAAPPQGAAGRCQPPPPPVCRPRPARSSGTAVAMATAWLGVAQGGAVPTSPLRHPSPLNPAAGLRWSYRATQPWQQRRAQEQQQPWPQTHKSQQLNNNPTISTPRKWVQTLCTLTSCTARVGVP